jgi:hypothetical protein
VREDDDQAEAASGKDSGASLGASAHRCCSNVKIFSCPHSIDSHEVAS